MSGASRERPSLGEALGYFRESDTLVVWKLEHLGRSLKDLIEKVEELQERGADFKSLQEGIDTTTSTGKLVSHIFGALAECEHDIIRERTLARPLGGRKVGGCGL